MMDSNHIDQWLKNSEVLQDLPEEVLAEIRRFASAQVDRIHELVKIGMALSAEKKLERLLEMIVREARRFTNADGGTLYIKNEEDFLEFKIIQNDTLGISVGGTGQQITWQPVPLRDASGVENHRNVSAHCALIGEAINIDDVYRADFDFQGTRMFDSNTGYRSRSMLLVPMRGHEDDVIGVLQLLNARESGTGEVISFKDHEIADITSLASQAAIAITNVRLVRELETLMDAFLRAIAAAIDEKSPYTGGHVENVAELTVLIAEEISRTDSGAFAELNFCEEELAELKMAAWMHDVGKVTTPEYVVDKATKLQTIFDRIELVRARVEILKKEAEISRLKAELVENGGEHRQPVEEFMRLDEMLAFLEDANFGGEYLADEMMDRISTMGRECYEAGGRVMPLLTDDEIRNLSIRKGTLNSEERAIINNHVSLTIKMLEKLPFPKKLIRVPDFAGMHHEKLDGSGYPRGLSGDQIPLQARIMAVADVFEALTAADRPYKPGKKLSESMRIIGFMVKDGHLDKDICDLLVSSGLVHSYGCRKVTERQRDDFEWQGERIPLNC